MRQPIDFNTIVVKCTEEDSGESEFVSFNEFSEAAVKAGDLKATVQFLKVGYARLGTYVYTYHK